MVCIRVKVEQSEVDTNQDTEEATHRKVKSNAAAASLFANMSASAKSRNNYALSIMQFNRMRYSLCAEVANSFAFLVSH